jgi:hypothetical protein
MNAPRPRPEPKFQESSSAGLKALEIFALGIVYKLVLAGKLSRADVQSIFDELHLLSKGVNSSASVGNVLGHYKDLLEWMLEQPRPDAPPKKAA